MDKKTPPVKKPDSSKPSEQKHKTQTGMREQDKKKGERPTKG